jgi:ubiquinone/menaquinone biosynthesis C-methylase UbiE
MDWSMRGPEVGRLRARTLAAAEGHVLEVGFGTGLNLPHYPAAVHSLIALDPLDALRGRVEARIAQARMPVRRVALTADGRLPFDDAHFDCVVTTWTLCSIPDAGAALREMRRVLRPEGRYLFIEHGASEDAGVERWQRRLEPLHKRVAGGCHLTRRIDALIASTGFTLVDCERWVEPGPRVFTAMVRGSARP